MENNNDLIVYNKIPGITFQNNGINPIITSPFSTYDLEFYHTRESLYDPQEYRKFINNAIGEFRKSRRYSHYKAFLIDIGLNVCQVHGNINSEMAELEMHHNLINLFEIAVIITEHILNIFGYISTFDLIYLLALEHSEHNVCLIMLTKTPHQLYHNADGMYFAPNQCIGNWVRFIKKYNTGLTLDIAKRINRYIETTIKLNGESSFGELLQLRNEIKNWELMNQYYF